jgi:hypothetical protein
MLSAFSDANRKHELPVRYQRYNPSRFPGILPAHVQLMKATPRPERSEAILAEILQPGL